MAIPNRHHPSHEPYLAANLLANAKKKWTQTTTSFPASTNRAQNEHPNSTSHSYQVDPPQLARRLLICAWTISESLSTTALATKDFWFLMPMVEALVLGLAKGKPFSRERESPIGQIWSIFITSIAAIPTQLERGSRLVFDGVA